MKISKYLLGGIGFSLFWLSVSNGLVEAKQTSEPVMNRVLINGKIKVDTQDFGKLINIVKKNIGQTIVILPRSSYSGIWQQQPDFKWIKGKMISVFVNGKPVIDSKVPSKIVSAVSKNRGKRIVVKQRDKGYPEFSPQRMNVVLKGPYSKEVLQDYLKQVMVTENCLSTRPNKRIKQWPKGAITYNQYKNRSVISFSCKKTSDPRVRLVHEMSKTDYQLNMDWIRIRFGKEYFARTHNKGFFGGVQVSKKHGNGYFIIVNKSGKEIYEQIFKGVDVFSCG